MLNYFSLFGKQRVKVGEGREPPSNISRIVLVNETRRLWSFEILTCLKIGPVRQSSSIVLQSLNYNFVLVSKVEVIFIK